MVLEKAAMPEERNRFRPTHSALLRNSKAIYLYNTKTIRNSSAIKQLVAADLSEKRLKIIYFFLQICGIECFVWLSLRTFSPNEVAFSSKNPSFQTLRWNSFLPAFQSFWRYRAFGNSVITDDVRRI
jgi:hypothetical protein